MSRTTRNPGKQTRRDRTHAKRAGMRDLRSERRGWRYALKAVAR